MRLLHLGEVGDIEQVIPPHPPRPAGVRAGQGVPPLRPKDHPAHPAGAGASQESQSVFHNATLIDFISDPCQLELVQRSSADILLISYPWHPLDCAAIPCPYSPPGRQPHFAATPPGAFERVLENTQRIQWLKAAGTSPANGRLTMTKADTPTHGDHDARKQHGAAGKTRGRLAPIAIAAPNIRRWRPTPAMPCRPRSSSNVSITLRPRLNPPSRSSRPSSASRQN